METPATGGELQKHIIEPDGGFLKVGDEVVIFLNESGQSWGSMGVLKVMSNHIDHLTCRLVDKIYLISDPFVRVIPQALC